MSHFAAEFGGGWTTPANESQHDLTYGWDVVAGAGYKFNRKFSLLGEYQFNSNKIPGKVLAQVGEPGGDIHIWSLTVAPVWNYKTSGVWGGYVTGGGGYYRKTTSFTEPALITGYYCDYFYCYPYQYVGDVVVAQFSTNQGGVNIGGGFTFGNWSGGKLYAEARYTWIDTPGRAPRLFRSLLDFAGKKQRASSGASAPLFLCVAKRMPSCFNRRRPPLKTASGVSIVSVS